MLSDGHVTGIQPRFRNRASQLIEDFMVAANGVIARHAARPSHILHPPRGEDSGALGPHRGTGRAHRRHPARRSGLRRAQPLPDEAPGGGPCALRRSVAGGGQVDGAGRVRAGASRRYRGRAFRPGRARLHAFDGAQPPLRRPGDAAPGKGGARQASLRHTGMPSWTAWRATARCGKTRNARWSGP